MTDNKESAEPAGYFGLQVKKKAQRHLSELKGGDTNGAESGPIIRGEDGDPCPREVGNNADTRMADASTCPLERGEGGKNESPPAAAVSQCSSAEMESPAQVSVKGDEKRGDDRVGPNQGSPEALGEVRLRRNSIQERRKTKGPLGPCQELRLPVQRSESLQCRSPERLSDSGPESSKSDPVSSPFASSSQSGLKSPARVILNRVFSFHGTRSPCKKSPPCSPGATTHDSRKRSPTESKKRRTLHLPLNHSPSPTSRNQNSSRFSFEWSSKSSPPKTPPKSPKAKDSRKTKSPNSPLLESVFKSRSQFFVPSPSSSKDGSVFVPGLPLNGTIEKMDGAGILYRPAGLRADGTQRNHRRTMSDTFRVEADQGKTVRKRSRDDSECDAVQYELRTKGVDGGLYLPRGGPGEERMRGEATGDYMLDLLERMSNYRIDDQRCSLPHNIHHPQQGMREGPGKPPPDKDEATSKTTSRHRLEEILSQPGPYPQVVLPTTGGYWDEHSADGDHQYVTNNSNNKFETDETALFYRRYFLGNEHWTFFGEDEVHGPVVLSHKREVISSQENLRVLLRLKTGTHHATIINLGDNPTPAKMAKRLKEELTVERFHPVVTPEGPELILAYDEHVLKNHFKFGLIYQRFGQTMEEQLFSNRGHLAAFEEFLSLMGQRVKLKDHEGFKGGLDTQFGQTGEESIYEVFREKEIMFHVSTLLPYKENDSQQLERKRHIGNDMVAVVFQEANTPFAPDMIASHFLHAYIVIQPIDPCTQNTRYRVSVTARSDVPFFGPTLPPTSIFDKGPHFKEFLLTKLINAEIACYKAERFAKLEMRTRSSLLSALVDDLRMKTNEYLGVAEIPETPKVETAGNKFREIVRSVLIGRKNPDPAGVLKKPISNNANTLVTGTPVSTRSKGSGGSSGARTPTSSPDTTPNTHMALSESDDSSLNSMDIDGHPHPLNEDSDTGLESMSSAETPHKLSLQCPLCGGNEDGVCALHADPETVMRQVETLKHEINKLKCDKLDLLRQNVTCQREIKKLKEKELKLGGELSTASKEILRLQNLLKDLGTGQVSAV